MNYSMSSQKNTTYCDFKDVRRAFLPYHCYLSLIICVFGSITNVLNIYILTRKALRSPTNLILTGLALANLLVMLEYVPFVFLFNANKEFAAHFSYDLAAFVIFHALFAQALHFISCSLSVILAVWQYIAVKFPQNNNKWCNNQRTTITILLNYLICPLVCIPLNFSLKIITIQVPIDGSGKILKKATASSQEKIFIVAYENDQVQKVSSYVYAFVIKLVPCVLLTVLSLFLILELLGAKERRRNLEENNITRKKPSQRFLAKEKQVVRTTRMLLTVLLLFLMVELPQAIFGLLNIIIGNIFELECYQPLGDIVDVLTLTNSSINFILYCIMSKKFRMVFKEAFFPYLPCAEIATENSMSLQTTQTNV